MPSLRTFLTRLSESAELRIYRGDPRAWREADRPDAGERDSWAALLGYQPTEGWQASREAFLDEARARLARGEHVYTLVEQDRLLHYGWLIESQRQARFSEVRQEFRFPPGSAVLYDFYTVPSARGRGLYQKNLRRMLSDAARLGGVAHVYITVLADNGPSRRVIEKTGFVYQGSMGYRRVLWAVRTWSTLDPARGGAPDG